MEKRLDRASSTSEGFGDGCLGPVLVKAQHHSCALTRREPAKHVVKQLWSVETHVGHPRLKVPAFDLLTPDPVGATVDNAIRT